MNKKTLYPPQIDTYVRYLSSNCSFNCDVAYDDETLKNIDLFFDEIKKIAPINDNDGRELWIEVERGPITVFGDYEELKSCGEVKNRKEYKKLWELSYPNPTSWYNIYVVEDEETNYKAIAINNKAVIQIAPDCDKKYKCSAIDLTNWLVLSVRKVIKDIKSGTYMNNVRANLPVICKTGTILRSDFWNVLDGEKEAFFKGLNNNDIFDFVSYMNYQNKHTPPFQEYIKSMTANDYYKYCALGYSAMNYEGGNLPPREQYKKNADNRDEGLSKIDGDSPSAFDLWFHDKNRGGGHPWEVCRGGSSTHISFIPRHNDEGYFFYLAGAAYTRSSETIKFYLALRRNNIPVILRESDILMQRVLGTEKVGVVPHYVFPRYCEDLFPAEKVISFTHLPDECIDEMAAKCVWQDISDIKLL